MRLDTEQKHGKHGSGALLNPRVLVEWESCGRPFVLSASGKLVDESLNEWETRCWLTLKLVDVETQNCSLVAGRDAKSLSGEIPGVRTDSITMEEAVRALQLQVNALMSQNAALEAQLQQNIAQGLAVLLGAITIVLSRSQAPTRRMLVDPKGLGKPPVFLGREVDF